MTRIRPMVKSRRNMEKNGNNNEISDGVSVLLVIYTDWKKNQTIENVRQL